MSQIATFLPLGKFLANLIKMSLLATQRPSPSLSDDADLDDFDRLRAALGVSLLET
jgi:hypothetical protein